MKKHFRSFALILTTLLTIPFLDNLLAQNTLHSSQPILRLEPDAENYKLEKNFRDELRLNHAVTFRATIKNNSDSTVTIAHPGACQPDSVEYPLTFEKALELREGQSEILIYITRPNGHTIKMRERTYPYFEWVEKSQPGNIAYLVIPPDSSTSFHVGWFFMNPRGRWIEDEVAAQIFLERGTFRVQLRYQNIFTDCQVPDQYKLWTGTLLSNEIAIEIK